MTEQDKTLKWSVIKFAVALLVAVGLVVFLSVREGGRSKEVQEAIIENCESSPVRLALTEILLEEIEETHNPRNKEFAQKLGITPEELHELLHEKIEKKNERLDEIEPSDCESQYQR